MSVRTVSFRTPNEKLKKLDSLAKDQHRDRTFLINEALDQYLEVQHYHKALIEEGLRQAEEGRLTPHDKVIELTRTWSKER
jgi:RHH-type transcriptional regulator, rel operon repressor / antitoxin RelB